MTNAQRKRLKKGSQFKDIEITTNSAGTKYLVGFNSLYKHLQENQSRLQFIQKARNYMGKTKRPFMRDFDIINGLLTLDEAVLFSTVYKDGPLMTYFLMFRKMEPELKNASAETLRERLMKLLEEAYNG